jgi:enoyl-CoA hydratase/carnithine racemase
MISPKSFRYEQSAGTAWITLDRPQSLNSLTFEVYRELTDTFRALGEEREVRAVAITGTGRAFCTGGDVKDIIGELLGRDYPRLLEFTRMTCDLVRAIRTLRKPVVAALNGTTAGAGAAIAIACDLRLAAESARIAFLFVRVGLAGADMGAAQLLPRLIGLGRASELLMTGEFVDAHEALRIGLYNRVVSAERLREETEGLLDRLVRGPAEGLAWTKAALEAETHVGLDAALENEARIQAELMLRPDFREGFDAFMARRAPRFEGAPE